MKVSFNNGIGFAYNATISQNPLLIKPESENKNYHARKSFQGLIDNNYGRLLVNKPKTISFGEDLKPISENESVPVKSPLESSLSTVFQAMGANDIVLIGSNVNQSEALLEESIDAVDNIIRKVFFIKEPSLKGSVAFFMNSNGFTHVLSLNKDPLSIKFNSQGKAVEGTLAKGQSSYIPANATITVDDFSFSVTDYESSDSKNFDKAKINIYNFSGLDQGSISKLNNKHLESLINKLEKQVKKPKKITFKDVGGQDEAINELKKAVLYPIKYPEIVADDNHSHGVLLEGEPGTGKTLIAQALANESDAHFIKLNGLELTTKWVGETEENWRKLFAEAEKTQPCIIFIDEFDAVAMQRGGSDISRYDDKVVNQLLTIMSDLEKNNTQVYVVAATNRTELLDGAITRSGRFGHHIKVGKPDLEGCARILDINLASKKVDDTFVPSEFSKKLYNAKVTGADIAFIVNDAKSNAYQRLGFYKKMEDGTFNVAALSTLKLTNEDFIKALKSFLNSNENNKKYTIGFSSPAKSSEELAAA